MDKKILIIASVLLFFVSTYFSFDYFKNTSPSGQAPKKASEEYKSPVTNDAGEVETNEPKTESCPLNGEMLTKTHKDKWEKRRPLAMMVENSTDARPQSGLNSADIIYEAVAEGGITRFMAMYFCHDAPYIGPVRSARVYYIELLQQYGASPLYGHVGGANTPGPADALGLIRKLKWAGYNDLNQFAVPFPYYYRDYDRLPDRATEHTVYTSTKKIWEYAEKKRKLTASDAKGVTWDTGFKPWTFIDDAPTTTPTASSVKFHFWDNNKGDFEVIWNYDQATNSYKRTNGGSPHLDKNTGKPLTAKNIAIMLTPETFVNDGYEAGRHMMYKTVGAGKALVFQNGEVKEGNWRRSKVTDRLEFIEKSGKMINMVKGKVFVELLPATNKVDYQ